MLKTKIEETTALVKKYNNLLNRDLKREKVLKTLKLIKGLNKEAKDFINSYIVLHRESPNDFPKLEPDLLNDLIIVQAEVKENEIPGDYRINNLEKKISDHIQNLKENWEEYVENKIGNTKKTLQIMMPLLDDASEVETVINKLDIYRKAWPIQEDHLIRLSETIESGNSIISGLKVNNEIKIFLQKVMNQEARLIDLKPNILNWLQDNKMDKYLIISLKE